jgi:hypothetical protein
LSCVHFVCLLWQIGLCSMYRASVESLGKSCVGIVRMIKAVKYRAADLTGYNRY